MTHDIADQLVVDMAGAGDARGVRGLLQSQGARLPHECLHRALVEAAKNGHKECVACLLPVATEVDFGVHTLPDGSPYFSYRRFIAGIRDAEIVRNQSPLMCAATPEIAQMLLKAGATGGLGPGVLELLRDKVRRLRF